MKMKKLAIIIFSLMISLSAFSQKGKREQLKALKVSFITEKLNLTEKEAQSFWPIYNAYEQNMHKYRYSSLRKLRHEIKDNYNVLTEAQAEAHLNKYIEIENKIHEERNTLISKLRGVIPSKKIIALKAAEEDFNRKMLDQFRKLKKGMHQKN